MFDDPDLFDNFITPCKEERRLNGIIVKCLKAYYTDERVRNMIEGGLESDDEVSEAVASTQEICDSIRASLIMQDYLVDELKQTVEDGMDDVTDILSGVNKRAETHGFGASYQTKSGSTILQLEAPKQKAPTEESSTTATAPASAPDGLAAILCQAVLLLAKDSNNSQVTSLLQQAGFAATQVIPTETVETPRQQPATQVQTATASTAGDFVEEGSVVDLDTGNDFGSEPAPAVEPEKAPEPTREDALDAMKDLFGSL